MGLSWPVLLATSAVALYPETAFSGAELNTVDGRRGVFAITKLPAGSAILELSQHDEFTVAACRANPKSFVHLFSHENVLVMEPARTLDVMCLMDLRANSSWSRFHAWFDLLPQQPDLPLLWHRKRRLWPPMKFLVERTRGFIRKLYEDTANALKYAAPYFTTDFSIDDLTWAYAMFASRANKAPWNDRAILPGMDMMNHANAPTAHLMPGSGNTVRVELLHSLNAGMEVTLDYGFLQQASCESMLQFGFIDAGAPASTVVEVDRLQGGLVQVKLGVNSTVTEVGSRAVSLGVASSVTRAIKRLREAAAKQLAAIPKNVHPSSSLLAETERQVLQSFLVASDGVSFHKPEDL